LQLQDASVVTAEVITVTKILGTASEPAIAGRLHDLHHDRRVETLYVDRDDTLRRRLRRATDKGTEIAVALDRSEQLVDGAVLVLDDTRAVVVRMTRERWLRVVPRDLDAALEAGYFIGNLHWRVRHEAGALLVAMEGPADHYIARLDPLIKRGLIGTSPDE
jgi:urease accessory protein